MTEPTSYRDMGKAFADILGDAVDPKATPPETPPVDNPQPDPPPADKRRTMPAPEETTQKPAAEPAKPAGDAKTTDADSDPELAAELAKIDSAKAPTDSAGWKAEKELRKQLNRDKRNAEKRAQEAADKLAKLEAELATAKTAAPPDYDAVKKELDDTKRVAGELDEVVRRNYVQDHPGFKARFDAQINQHIETARRIVGPEKSDAVARILRLGDQEIRDQRLAELVDDLPPLAASRLSALLNTLESVQSERQAQIDYWSKPENIAQIKAARENEQRAAAEQTAKRVRGMVDAIRKDAEFGSMTDDDANAVFNLAMKPPTNEQELTANLRLVAQGRLYGPTKKALDDATKRVSELEALVKSLEGASPGLASVKIDGKPQPKPERRTGPATALDIGKEMVEAFQRDMATA